MLVLSRKRDQEVIIDGNISIRVISIKGNTIRLGISAPPEVSILRGEIAKFPARKATEVENPSAVSDPANQSELDREVTTGTLLPLKH